MRILFAGTPEIAVPSLERIYETCTVAGVLTSPDTKKGRGRKLLFNPVKEKALELGLPVLQPERLRREAFAEIASLEADLLVAYAYGKIFGPRFLSLFPRGAVNVHPSLLPKYRGSTPITAAILNGDSETGVTVQTMELEVDSGDILGRRVVPLDGDETTATLSERMALEGAALLEEVLPRMEAEGVQEEKQDEEKVTFCRRLNKRDGEVNWLLPAEMIERMVRAFDPWPRAYTYWKGKRLAIIGSRIPLFSKEYIEEDNKKEEKRPAGSVVGMDREEGILVQTGRGVLGLTELQLEGKKSLSWEQFLNGNRDFLHACLGDIK